MLLVYGLISFGGGMAVSVMQGPLSFLFLLFGYHYLQELLLAYLFLYSLSPLFCDDLLVTKCRGSQWLSLFRISQSHSLDDLS